MTIADLKDEEFILVTSTKDTISIQNDFPNTDCDSFFVKVGDGEYTEVYGFYGIVPWNYKPCYKLL